LSDKAARPAALSRFEYRQAAGAVAQAVIKSVELIVQPDAHDVVGEMGVGGNVTGNSSALRSSSAQIAQRRPLLFSEQIELIGVSSRGFFVWCLDGKRE
jgi:hypothetical protein